MTLTPAALIEREQRAFAARRPAGAALAARAGEHWLSGVPLHWMADWGTPFPLIVREAQGVTLQDVDGHRYTDFCLGDTGAMFGHSPEIIAAAIAAQASRGLACMLPAASVAEVGEALAARFGLPYWQITHTATEANRAVLRWARAITRRREILVFHGAYHGIVDETMVRLRGGRTVAREGAIGPAFDPTIAAVAVEFNDLDALEHALRTQRIAAVLAEPVMTNVGMVLPDEGYLQALRALTRRYGTLLVIDETHTISSGPGGYSAAHRLEPDFWVCGKAIAGGLACAVFGFTREMEEAMRAVLAARAQDPESARHGSHSGMGTTLAANPLVLATLAAALNHLHTAETYLPMMRGAERLASGLRQLFVQRGLDWHVSQVGARVEFGFGPAPRNGRESEAQMRPELEQALHLWLLNRGLLVTPFHNMLLTAPMLPSAAVEVLCAEIGEFLDTVDVHAGGASR